MTLKPNPHFTLHYENGVCDDVIIGAFPDKNEALSYLNASVAAELKIGPFDIEDEKNQSFEPIFYRLIERLNGDEVARDALVTKMQMS